MPFSLKPVHLPQPTPRAKRTRLVPLASSDEDDSGSDSGADESDDSEEDVWPVGPIGSIGLRGWRRHGKGKGNDSERIFGGPDALDKWEQQQQQDSWATANRSVHLSISRALSASPAPPARATKASTDTRAIEQLLSSLQLAQSDSQQKLVASFEARNKALWQSIESCILHAEHEEGEKQRALEDQRRKGEEAQAKAKAMREAEERKKEKDAADREKKRVQDEAQKKKDDDDRKQAAVKLALEQAQQSDLLAKQLAAEGESPQADFQRWTAKMAVGCALSTSIRSRRP